MVTNKRKIIGIDFDGTVVTHNYPFVGNDIGAVPVLKKLIDSGCDLVLTTMRCDTDLDDAIKWFYDNKIKLSGIYKHETQEAWTKSPKCYCDILIDDCACGAPLKKDSKISSRKFIDWYKVEEILISEGYIK